MYRIVILLLCFYLMCQKTNVNEEDCQDNVFNIDNKCIELAYLYINKWGNSSDTIGNVEIYLSSKKMELPGSGGVPIDTAYADKIVFNLKYVISKDIYGNYKLDNGSIKNGNLSIIDTTNKGMFYYDSIGSYCFVSGNVIIKRDNNILEYNIYEITFDGILSNNKNISGYFKGVKSIMD